PLRAYAAAQLLLYQSWWRGDMVAARLVFELAPGPDADARPVPAALIAWTVAQSVYQGLMHGEPADAMALLDNGLALGRRSEVHAWDSLLLGQSLWCCLSTGKLAEARAFARRMARSLRPGRHLDHSYYHHLSSILALHEGDHPAMRAHAQAALRCARDAGVPWAEGIVLCAVARAQALHGDASAARLSLDEAEALAARIRSDTVHFDVLLARLELGLGQTGTPDPDDTLRRWMGLWCRSGFTNFPWWRDAVVATQCAKALAHGIEPEFVRKIIRARRLQPPPDAPVPPSWQLPVEIRVLGPFGIEIDGRAIAASGKTPKKPLELLKLLVALGGQACKTRLAEVLWPHLDDIAAQQVLRVTLHRLRNLVGHDGIVCLAGRVSIDEHRCRVDLLGMFRDLASLEQAPGQQADLLFDLLARHAAGVFPGEPEAGWAADVRHQLRARLSACLHARTQACAAAAQWEDLAACCERGLAFDAHDAAFHHGLIQACLELGRPREARDAYLRCVELVPNQADLPLATLRARLGGTPPSARPISF
ncbi:MAG: AfsR/SARP family transcriptional regulator, partial [Thiomonas delicata]